MWENIISAQRLRAFDFDRMNPVTRLRRAYVPIVTPLVLLLFRKANDFQIALETRAFGTPGNPTEIEERPFRRSDWAMLVFILAVFVFAQVLRIRIKSI